ncbi:right-handed parallel beta-helix repeat-containing protein [Aetokthonos hydrillicola]|nr:right-handed parallel beta-helix repeat-containing protein [Aetokthonos hydrillicola]
MKYIRKIFSRNLGLFFAISTLLVMLLVHNVTVAQQQPNVATSAGFTLVVTPNGQGKNCTEYDPCSLEDARTKARSLASSMTEDIVIMLEGGVYQLTQPLTLTSDDSGQNNHFIVYQAKAGQKPVISAGIPITGWQYSQQPGVVMANLSNNRIFRRLYVNEKPAIRARQINSGSFLRLQSWDETNKRIEIDLNDIGYHNDFTGWEVTVHRHWSSNHMRVKQITVTSGNTAFVELQEPEAEYAFSLLFPPREPNQSYYFENAKVFLDAPGEFYLDSNAKIVYYVLQANENPATLSAIAPNLEKILTIQGRPDNPVHHIKFSGLTFAHADWLEPGNSGFLDIQAGIGGDKYMPAGVEVSNAHTISFDQDTFNQMTASGLNFYRNVKNVTISNCIFQDLGGQGLALDAQAQKIGDTAPVSNIAVIGNTLTRTGQIYPGSVGLFAGYVANVTIEGNELFAMPYTGISVGWGWSPYETVIHDNIIRNNKIHQVMQSLDDGAGIYTLSNQPGTIIEGNYIYDLVKSPFAENHPIVGIYLDEGSDHITVQSNVIQNVPMTYHFNKNGNNNTIRG